MLLVVTNEPQRQLLLLLQFIFIIAIKYFLLLQFFLTITAIIAALHDEGHQGPLEQGFIGNRLHGTDVSEFSPATTILWSLSATKVLVSLIMSLNWCCPDPFG